MKYDIKRGDMYQLGDHRLLCADSTQDDITRLFTQKVRLICTDPPYGVAYVENKRHFKGATGESQVSVDREIANDHIQTEPEYEEFTAKWLKAVIPHLASYNACYIFNSDLMFRALRNGMDKAGYYYSQMLIWVKNSVVVGRKDYLPQHEVIAYGWYGRHKFERSKDRSILSYPKPTKAKLHPTMKPVGLLRKIINNSSLIGETVFDPFGGSGSTLIACEQLKRKCVMTEIDPVYCDTIVRRWEEVTGRSAQKVE